MKAEMRDARRAPEAGSTSLPAWMVLAALAVGVLQALGFGALAHWSVNLLALVLLLVLLQTAWAAGLRLRSCLALGWCFGLAHFSVGLAWLHHSMHHIGGMPFVLSVLAVLLFAAYLAVFPALAVGIASWVLGLGAAGGQGRGSREAIPAAAALACAWWLTEAARGWLFTGFPWLSVGYGQIDGPLASSAAIVGVQGVSALAVFSAALVASALRPAVPTRLAGIRLQAPALAAALLIILPLAPIGSQHWVEPAGHPLKVRLLQGNVAQDLKFEPQRTLQAMNDYLQDFERGDAQFTLLPETAWTVPWSMTPPELVRRALDRVQSGHHLAVGLPRWREPDPNSDRPSTVSPSKPSDQAQPANSVMLLAPDRAPGPTQAHTEPGERVHARPPTVPIYDKHHLVPFGEFIPWGFGWFVRQMQIPLGDFARGARVQPPFEVEGQRIAMNICYEDLFGEEIRLPVLHAQATLLANVSNLGWFGRSSALGQHLTISRFRSLETGRPMLRATNTGMTAVIDHAGQIRGLLEPHARGALEATVQGMTGLTPYVRFGHWPGLICSAIVLAIIGGLSRRRGAS